MPNREPGDGWKRLPDESLTPFARRMRQYLRDEWMGLSDFSRRTGGTVSVSTISDWFYRGTRPRLDTVRVVARATGIPLDELRALAKRETPLPRSGRAAWAEVLREIADSFEQHPDVDEVTRQYARDLFAGYLARLETEGGADGDGPPENGERGPVARTLPGA